LKAARLTGSAECLAAHIDLDSRRLALCIPMTARQEPPCNQFIHALFVAVQIVGRIGRVDGRMGFIVLAAIAGTLILAVDQSASQLVRRLAVYVVDAQGTIAAAFTRSHLGSGSRAQELKLGS
jgi:hypothetical protein